MEWRCEWCGKPHEEDDPPCDNCGHGSFEKAIVARPDLAADGDPETMTVWVCTNCGRHHPKHSPPCSRCNNAELTKEEVRVDEDALTDRPDDGEYETVSTESITVWECTACGKEHARFSLPCNRCGHTELEPREKSVDEAELAAPGYMELLTSKYALALGLTLLLVVVFALGATGLADVPGFPSDSLEDPDDVPGEAETSNGLDLAAVEDAYLARLNDARAAAGADALERNSDLDDIARAYNQWQVLAAFEDVDPPSESDLSQALSGVCDRATYMSFPQPLADTDDADAVGTDLFASVETTDTQLTGPETTDIGLDVHVAEGTLYFTQFTCQADS